ncbi:MAG: hypothetical protein KDC87_01950 [Planctomycetes bacterium]|nr:hypothetical protein [Planctomycetota bacterium]
MPPFPTGTVPLRSLVLAICGLAATGTGQVSLIPLTKMGVFARLDTAQPTYVVLSGSPTATAADPLAVAVDELDATKAPIAHARTKVSLRVIEGLPIARVFESGFVTTLTNARSRAVGTAAPPATSGAQIVPHSWLLRYTGTPGQRVRVQFRLRSSVAGSATISGVAKVDVGNDNSVEFNAPLDGSRYMGNHTLAIGSSGVADVRIETGVLLTSTSASPAGYNLVLDVAYEPLRGMLASVSPYGPLCGPEVFGVSWESTTNRWLRLLLEGAPANTPTTLIAGVQRIQLPLPGVTCELLTQPVVMVPMLTNSVGRLISDLDSGPLNGSIDARFQFASWLDQGRSLALSRAIGYRVFEASDAPFTPCDVNHILVTGQSLAMGGLGSPVQSKTQPYGNLMFSGGVRSLTGRLSPLVESFWETPSSGMANTASRLFLDHVNDVRAPRPTKAHDALVSVHAQPGHPYSLLRKGTQPFQDGINQFRVARHLADQNNQSYAVRCVAVVHGEEDHARYNGTYGDDLIEWQRDYESEIQSLGQTEPVPLLHSQLSSHSSLQSPWSFIPDEQLRASVSFPRRVVLVCPKYTFDYLDGVHLTGTGYRHMGEYYGKVYNHVVLEGGTWEPLRPVTVRLEGAQITVRFHVPEPPLVLDTTSVVDPGNFGFEYTDSSPTPPRIRKVSLVDEDTIRIELDAAPTAAAKFVRYAYTGKPGAFSGPKTGVRGNLRDSDDTPSLYASPLHNWCVQFSWRIR